MPNLNEVLKAEITRLARKEIKGQLEASRQMVSKHRHEIAALKREVKALETRLGRIQKSGASQPAEASDAESGELGNVRFSAKSVRSQRRRLNLSAAEFAKLLGVSAQTIYLWESGRSRPRQAQLQSLVAVREMGRREAQARLAESQE